MPHPFRPVEHRQPMPIIACLKDACDVYTLHAPTSQVEICRIFIDFQFF